MRGHDHAAVPAHRVTCEHDPTPVRAVHAAAPPLQVAGPVRGHAGRGERDLLVGVVAQVGGAERGNGGKDVQTPRALPNVCARV